MCRAFCNDQRMLCVCRRSGLPASYIVDFSVMYVLFLSLSPSLSFSLLCVCVFLFCCLLSLAYCLEFSGFAFPCFVSLLSVLSFLSALPAWPVEGQTGSHIINSFREAPLRAASTATQAAAAAAIAQQSSLVSLS